MATDTPRMVQRIVSRMNCLLEKSPTTWTFAIVATIDFASIRTIYFSVPARKTWPICHLRVVVLADAENT